MKEQKLKTVRVYIAVAVDVEGKWCAGGSHKYPARDLFHDWGLADDLENGESHYIVTAELALPMAANVTEVEGEVCSESQPMDPAITKQVSEILKERGFEKYQD